MSPSKATRSKSAQAAPARAPAQSVQAAPAQSVQAAPAQSVQAAPAAPATQAGSISGAQAKRVYADAAERARQNDVSIMPQPPATTGDPHRTIELCFTRHGYRAFVPRGNGELDTVTTGDNNELIVRVGEVSKMTCSPSHADHEHDNYLLIVRAWKYQEVEYVLGAWFYRNTEIKARTGSLASGFPANKSHVLSSHYDVFLASRLAGPPPSDELTNLGLEPFQDFHAKGLRPLEATDDSHFARLVRDLARQWSPVHGSGGIDDAARDDDDANSGLSNLSTPSWIEMLG